MHSHWSTVIGLQADVCPDEKSDMWLCLWQQGRRCITFYWTPLQMLMRCCCRCSLPPQDAHALPGAAGARGAAGGSRGGRRGANSLASPGTPTPSGGGITCVLFLPQCSALASAGRWEPISLSIQIPHATEQCPMQHKLCQHISLTRSSA
jgi:hypothetical protein